MVQIVCKCLNVGIHCKESQLISTSIASTDDNSYHSLPTTDDHFFKDTVLMTLALAGITMEHDNLCWSRIVGQWAINHCAVCRTDTHATHITKDNQRRILVNINLESNASRIESLRSGANYSPVFRIVLPVKFDNQSVKTTSALITSQSGLETKKRLIQQKVQRFLSEEQKLMEERIRTFTEQEHNRFADMQLKIGRNEESLYHILDDIALNIAVHSNPEQSLTYSSAQHLNCVENDDSELGLNSSYLTLNSVQNIANQKVLDNKQKKSQTMRNRSQSVDLESHGGIFNIDVDDGNAFDSISYSDEEDEDSIAFKNSNNENNYNNRRAVPNAQHNAQTNGHHMAYSLPIQVPKWKTFYNHKEAIDEDEVPMIPNGETIAESIKKLAKSVRNESDIFGDRPRARINTGDLIRGRPI